MFSVKKQVCNRVYCRNWYKIKSNLETKDEARRYIAKTIHTERDYEMRYNGHRTRLTKIYGIFDEEDKLVDKIEAV